jgi:hypothetical protein
VKPFDWINIALAYVVTVAVANLIIHMLGYNKPAIALSSGAVVATEVAAWSWQIRKGCAAGATLKLQVGGLIAALSLTQALVFQALFKWMARPSATIAVIAIASLALPPLTFEVFRRTLPAGKRKR